MKQRTPETIARSYLPRTTLVNVGTEIEIQVGNQGFMYRFTSNQAPYGTWDHTETNQIGESVKRGRPKGKIVPIVQTVKAEAVHTESDVKNIESTTGLIFSHNEKIDDYVDMPVFKKRK